MMGRPDILACDLAPIDERSLEVTMAAARYQARRLARSLRLAETEREDAEQEILLILLERRRYFDPLRGPWAAFAHRIARQAAQVIADEICAVRRRQPLSLDQTLQHPGDDGSEHGATISDVIHDPAVPPDEQALMAISVSRFLRGLPAELHIAAMAISEADGDLAAAQRGSGLSSSEFYRRLREIRYRLVSIGLMDRRALFDL